MSVRQDELWNSVGKRDFPNVRRLVTSRADVNMVCPDGWVREERAVHSLSQASTRSIPRSHVNGQVRSYHVLTCYVTEYRCPQDASRGVRREARHRSLAAAPRGLRKSVKSCQNL